MTKRLTYLDYALDETAYLNKAYSLGIRYNAMVAQAQRVCELVLKQIITRSLMNNTEVMMSHNLRELYDYISSVGIDLRPVRNEIMLLNNFYTHTRYPGRDAFMATDEDIANAVKSVNTAFSYMRRFLNES